MVARDHDYYQINSNVLWPVAEYAILWKPLSDLCCGRSTHRWEFIAQSQTVQEFMFYFCPLHNCIQLKYLGPISNNAYFNFTHRTRCMLTTMSTQNPLFLPKRFSYLSLSVRLKMWECWWKSVQSLYSAQIARSEPTMWSLPLLFWPLRSQVENVEILHMVVWNGNMELVIFKIDGRDFLFRFKELYKVMFERDT